MSRDSEPSEAPLEDVISALDDEDCRAIIRALETPMTARELMNECDLSRTTTYRKLNRLKHGGLLEEKTELRSDGHHTTRYHRAFAGVAIWLTGEDAFDVTMLDAADAPDKRLTELWKAMSEEL